MIRILATLMLLGSWFANVAMAETNLEAKEFIKAALEANEKDLRSYGIVYEQIPRFSLSTRMEIPLEGAGARKLVRSSERSTVVWLTDGISIWVRRQDSPARSMSGAFDGAMTRIFHEARKLGQIRAGDHSRSVAVDPLRYSLKSADGEWWSNLVSKDGTVISPSTVPAILAAELATVDIPVTEELKYALVLSKEKAFRPTFIKLLRKNGTKIADYQIVWGNAHGILLPEHVTLTTYTAKGDVEKVELIEVKSATLDPEALEEKIKSIFPHGTMVDDDSARE